MKLIDWMKKERYRITEIAQLSGVDKAGITMHINHGMRFGRRRAEKLEKATGGKVSVLELMFPDLDVKILKKKNKNKKEQEKKTDAECNQETTHCVI